MSRLVRDCEATMASCEATMEAMFASSASHDPWTSTNAKMAPIATEQGIFRNTVAALVAMRELSSWSSTYGHFSLHHWHQSPPCLSKACYCPSRSPKFSLSEGHGIV
ncbi:hypothetical protein QYE76_011167 [Lolium multiflorum]|uniref:Uncharacterized protein n=1 Tax=Lolium multiflorum TaxID=4521 RepID=A0AAD8TYP5_LOLMU|nr:hypothetical protein QYE76_011167 [Lolium multiflorum]